MKPKRKRAPQTFTPGSAPEHWDVYRRFRTELHRLASIGHYDGDPEQWHPAARLAALFEDPDCSASLRFLIWKELLQYIEVPKAIEMRGLNGPGSGAISIESAVAKPPSHRRGVFLYDH